jgi:hypothetical protein
MGNKKSKERKTELENFKIECDRLQIEYDRLKRKYEKRTTKYTQLIGKNNALQFVLDCKIEIVKKNS